MNWDDACKLVRVRTLALAAEVRAGGRPGAARIRRAIAPLENQIILELGAAGRAAARARPPPGHRGPGGAEL